MKVYKLTLTCLFLFFLPAVLMAQNLFLQKINLCDASDYCMDCGEVKATCTQFTVDYIADQISRKYIFKNGVGSINFQVLVDSTGFCCVYSYSDVTNSPVTTDLIRYLNGSIWHPALLNGKRVRASVNVSFRIGSGKMTGRLERMDLSEQQPPGPPTIYNKAFAYTNPSLKQYDFTVWTKYDSPLPDNIGQKCVVDKSDTVWYATPHGLTRFDGRNFNPVNEFNSPLLGETVAHDIVVDKDNNKWIYAYSSIYKYKNAGWQVIDFKEFLSSGVNRILNSRSGELLFTTKSGLVVVKGNRIVLLNKKTFKQMPSNDVYYTYNDSRKRLWIGTAGGNIMVDKYNFVTDFKNPSSPLAGVYITDAEEDEEGNLYFALRSVNATSGDDDHEGIAILKTDGKWYHYNDKNSGMPSNKVNSLLYDKFEHVLWIATAESGLVRYDLNNGWENYNNSNSGLPGFAINELSQDSKGTIYAGTDNGMVRMKKK